MTASPGLPADPAGLAAAVLDGQVRAAARAMRWADDRDPRADALLSALHPHSGRARIVGVTGNPGSGKSTLCDALVAGWRARGLTVGVVAVDPSSPFSGGAILGDRIRMHRHYTDPGVFIRSLATRGHLGGLSASTLDTASILDAMGRDVVLIETVGVGQDEVDIVRAADTTVVVLVPGLGDEVQALKAGILEIADVFCINKADRDGVDRLERELAGMQELDRQGGRATRPIVRTVATRADGVDDLLAAIDDHVAGEGDASERAALRIRSLVTDRLTARVLGAAEQGGALAAAAARVAERTSDPWREAEAIIAAGMTPAKGVER